MQESCYVAADLGADRYERRSMLITANQPFGDWGKVFPDQAMTLAAIDRLVHHATYFRDDCRELSPRSTRSQACPRTTTNARDNQAKR
jgi:hypothetical protein